MKTRKNNSLSLRSFIIFFLTLLFVSYSSLAEGNNMQEESGKKMRRSLEHANYLNC